MCRDLALAVMAAVLAACAGGAANTRPECATGQTNLDGTCVSQPIADYVACIRATGATVSADNGRSLAAAAGTAGVSASTKTEVKDRLEKHYATVSDSNALAIIHDCYAKTSASASTSTSRSAEAQDQALDVDALMRRARSSDGAERAAAVAELQRRADADDDIAAYWLGVVAQEGGSSAKATALFDRVVERATVPAVYRGWCLLRLAEIEARDSRERARTNLTEAARLLAGDAEARPRIDAVRRRLAEPP